MVPFRPIVMTSPNTAYREYAPHPALSSLIVCYWQSVPVKGKGARLSSVIVPDGCTYIIYDRDALTGRYDWSYCGMLVNISMPPIREETGQPHGESASIRGRITASSVSRHRPFPVHRCFSMIFHRPL